MLFRHLLIFFENQLFRKILSGIPSECQTVRIQVRPDIMSGLIWVPYCLQRLSTDNTGGQRGMKYSQGADLPLIIKSLLKECSAICLEHNAPMRSPKAWD